MIYIAVCDDDSAMCEHLLRLVKAQCEHCVVDIFCSGEALLLADKNYDIYLLDIQMLGVSGMEAARRLRKKQKTFGNSESVIIFVTALSEYMQDAFDVRALHYLVKP